MKELTDAELKRLPKHLRAFYLFRKQKPENETSQNKKKRPEVV